MDDRVQPAGSRPTDAKPATAARIYDYYLGGIHNFPADQEAARQVIAHYPFIPGAARANRAFLQRAVHFLASAGIRQFLDIGSGIPTGGNVHEIAQQAAAESRVVYVDIDPVAVSESLDLLEGNALATAIHGDLRRPQAILTHRAVARTAGPQPTGRSAARCRAALRTGRCRGVRCCRHVVRGARAGQLRRCLAHGCRNVLDIHRRNPPAEDVYRQRTATPGTVRTRPEVQRLFAGLELVDPGVTWAQLWRPDTPASADAVPAEQGGIWAGVGVKRTTA